MFPEFTNIPADRQQAIQAALAGLSADQLMWVSGLAAGASGSSLPVSNGGSAVVTQASGPSGTTPLTVIFGTESGNSEELADRSVKAAKKKGFKPVLKSMADIAPGELVGCENLLVFSSTWGDGEAPEAAADFYTALMGADLDFSKVNFAVCGLGDTSYEKFCQIGKDLDARFAELGGHRVSDRADCDVDFEETYENWFAAAIAALSEKSGVSVAVASAPAELPVADVAAPEFGKSNPFSAKVIDNVLLNGRGSSKETLHLELSLEGSGLSYEAGDALALIPDNADDVIDRILSVTGFSGNELVSFKDGPKKALRLLMKSELDITGLSKAVAKKYNAVANNEALEALLSDEKKEEFKSFVWGREIIDLFVDYPAKGEFTPQDFVACLRKLPPRLYSIASSPKAHEGEVHLTVAAVRYETGGVVRKGVASTFIADELKKGTEARVYVHKNKNFRLPEDTNVPVIMVGPGTGIAPFRAFIEERDETGNEGGTWLFFGDQKYNFDFLYQLELQGFLKSKSLTKLDVAFSRDQPKKVYVQDRLRERGEELWAWLEKGAHFYVCGDASRMAADVHQALIDVVAEHGKKSEEEAEAYVNQLKKDKRYQRDVY